MPEKLYKLSPWLLIFIGLLLLCIHVVFNLGVWTKSVFLNATHQITYPTEYKFATYDKLLHECVRDDLVDYAKLKQSPLLNQSIDELEKVSPDGLKTDQERMCFWINTYNLLVLKTIADRYPINSTRRIGSAFSSQRYLVGGMDTSAQDTYVDMINPFLKTYPKCLFLVCGGAMGYPPLLNHAIQPSRMAADAEFAVTEFIKKPDNQKYDDLTNTFYLSPLLSWNSDLFVPDYESPHGFINLYLPEGKHLDLGSMALTQTYFRTFDWRLNDTALEQKQESKQETNEKPKPDTKQESGQETNEKPKPDAKPESKQESKQQNEEKAQETARQDNKQPSAKAGIKTDAKEDTKAAK